MVAYSQWFHQNVWIKLSSPWLRRAAGWPPTPTSSWWCCWATLLCLCVIFFLQNIFWQGLRCFKDCMIKIERTSCHFERRGDHSSTQEIFTTWISPVPFSRLSRSHTRVHVSAKWQKRKLFGVKIQIQGAQNDSCSMSGWNFMSLIREKISE